MTVQVLHCWGEGETKVSACPSLGVGGGRQPSVTRDQPSVSSPPTPAILTSQGGGSQEEEEQQTLDLTGPHGVPERGLEERLRICDVTQKRGLLSLTE